MSEHDLTGPIDHALVLVGVEVPFGANTGLQAIYLKVERGERLVLLGASGTGKTTLLRGIAGLTPVASGRILVAGVDVTTLAPERRHVVYLHQTPLLFPHLNVFENIAFPLRIRRWPLTAIRERVEHLLAVVQLGGFGSRPSHALSGGQRHRVALARAIAAHPRVLLLDEPLTALDPQLRGETRQALLALGREEETAILMVTHDVEDATTLGHRVGVLAGGRLVQCDRPAELFRKPASLSVAAALGLPNRLAGRITARGFESELGIVPAPINAAPGPATAIFGAQALRVDARGPLIGRVVGCRPGPNGTVLELKFEGGTYLGLGTAGAAAPEGEDIRLTLDTAHMHVFEDQDVR